MRALRNESRRTPKISSRTTPTIQFPCVLVQKNPPIRRNSSFCRLKWKSVARIIVGAPNSPQIWSSVGPFNLRIRSFNFAEICKSAPPVCFGDGAHLLYTTVYLLHRESHQICTVYNNNNITNRSSSSHRKDSSTTTKDERTFTFVRAHHVMHV